jgi:hypothetical protein
MAGVRRRPIGKSSDEHVEAPELSSELSELSQDDLPEPTPRKPTTKTKTKTKKVEESDFSLDEQPKPSTRKRQTKASY